MRGHPTPSSPFLPSAFPRLLWRTVNLYPTQLLVTTFNHAPGPGLSPWTYEAPPPFPYQPYIRGPFVGAEACSLPRMIRALWDFLVGCRWDRTPHPSFYLVGLFFFTPHDWPLCGEHSLATLHRPSSRLVSRLPRFGKPLFNTQFFFLWKKPSKTPPGSPRFFYVFMIARVIAIDALHFFLGDRPFFSTFGWALGGFFIGGRLVVVRFFLSFVGPGGFFGPFRDLLPTKFSP